MLIWSDEFATGQPMVDEQHRMLIEKINRLGELLATPVVEARLFDQLLDFFGTYAATHFRFEENCMARLHCPKHEYNKDAHASFMKMFTGMRREYYDAGSNRDILVRLHQATQAWIADHILKIDTSLRACAPRKPGRAAGAAQAEAQPARE